MVKMKKSVKLGIALLGCSLFALAGIYASEKNDVAKVNPLELTTDTEILQQYDLGQDFTIPDATISYNVVFLFLCGHTGRLIRNVLRAGGFHRLQLAQCLDRVIPHVGIVIVQRHNQCFDCASVVLLTSRLSRLTLQ